MTTMALSVTTRWARLAGDFLRPVSPPERGWLLSAASYPGHHSCPRFPRSCRQRRARCCSPPRHPVPCRSDAHKIALVGTTRYPAGHHYVPFGYLILDAHLYIGEGVTIHASEFFDAFRAAYILRTCRIMAYKVRGEKLVCYFQVPLAARSENVKEAWA